MQGWIKLHRKLTEWEWYTDIPTKTLFIHLLLVVNHEPKKWRGKLIGVGEKVTSISRLAEETGLSVRQVRTALDKLIESKEIDTQATHQYTLVKVLNYAIYQDKAVDERQTSDTQDDTQVTRNLTNERQTSDTQDDNKQEYKNDKNDKNDKNEEITNYHNDDMGMRSQLKELIKAKGFENLTSTTQSLCVQYGLYKEQQV